MRFAILLILFAGPLRAALLAHVATTRGTVTVELQHDTAPKAVANFMTLAQGTRTRINAATGAATDSPLYIGEKFFRTANSGSFKFAQTGSGTGSNNGSSGFTFKDEFSDSVLHTGYTLSSANSGPNTNSGQIFFTGNAVIPAYNKVHSILGLVPDPASRAVIDAIIAAGDNGTTITGITVDRTDPAALAFDEMAQGLPSVEPSKGRLSVAPTGVTWELESPLAAGDLFVAKRSLAFTTWGSVTWDGVDSLHAGPNDPAISAVPLGSAAAPRAFYHLTIARHPGALAPSHFRSRQIHIAVGTTVTAYLFDPTGMAGFTVINPGTSSEVVAAFTLMESGTSAHGGFFVVQIPTFNPSVNIVQYGVNTDSGNYLSGRHAITYHEPGVFTSAPQRGTVILSK